jgi:hypothetical protein
LTPLITAYAQGTDKLTSLGPYFERPGRTILERHLVDVPGPREVLGEGGKLSEEERVYFAGESCWCAIHVPYPGHLSFHRGLGKCDLKITILVFTL